MERQFYERELVKNNWSLPELKISFLQLVGGNRIFQEIAGGFARAGTKSFRDDSGERSE